MTASGFFERNHIPPTDDAGELLVVDRIPYHMTEEGWSKFVANAREEGCTACDALVSRDEHDCADYVKTDYTNANGAPIYFVNVYAVDRAYGGPEEGGWWYDTGSFITGAVVTTRLDAVAAYTRLTHEHADQCTRCGAPERDHDERDDYCPRFRAPSVGSVVYDGGVFSVVLETHPGRDYPDARPRYE